MSLFQTNIAQALRAPSPLGGEGWGEGVRTSMTVRPQTPLAKRLRRQMTEAETLLWQHIRGRQLQGLKFKRQFPIDRYVVDFCCAEARLIVELDGGQHALQVQADETRTQTLSAMGYLVLRFWNNDVMSNINGVLETIVLTIKPQAFDPPHPNPLPQWEREQISTGRDV